MYGEDRPMSKAGNGRSPPGAGVAVDTDAKDWRTGA